MSARLAGLSFAAALVAAACASIAPQGPAEVADVAAQSAAFEVEGRLSARRGLIAVTQIAER